MKTAISRSRMFLLTACILATAYVVRGHFQVILPTTDYVGRPGPVGLSLLFTHPMADGPIMHMGKPRQFGVVADGKKIDLLKTLRVSRQQGKDSYSTICKIQKPGDHVFYLEPSPYWESAEQKMIIHYTKVVVNAMGKSGGWDKLVGLPVEIEPLTRPYGIWAGNSFRGIVRRFGKPVPFAEVEVEYLNTGKKIAIPNDVFGTQVIKADRNGVFSYTMPKAGWWGFAALVAGDKKMKNPAGKEVDVELGGLIWVRTVKMKDKK